MYPLAGNSDVHLVCIMSQVRRGTCVSEFSARPSLVERWFGSFTPVPRVLSKCTEESRRHDGLIPKFGSGLPTANSAVTDHWGLSAISTPSMETFGTPEGSIKLPKEVTKLHFLPSVATLESTAHSLDTRLQGLPPRYF